jgi:MerR family copper efflux transcriptional regulator
MDGLNIGEAAKASGVSAKMIRHYENAGLLPPAPRTDGGYRQYDSQSVHMLRFIRRARDLGFSIAEIVELVGLWRNRRRPSSRVKALAQAHIRELEVKARSLLAMKSTLEHLVECCHGDERPDCPILDELAGERPVRATPP